MRTAVIGLGAMGSRMAKRLVEAGRPVVVHNRTKTRASALVDAGAVWADTPREAAEQADLVLSIVTDDEAARAVWLHPEDGALAGLGEAVAVESSTVTPGWVAELAAAVGPRFIDAPVVGTRPHAEQGALSFLGGGDEDLLRQIEPHIAPMGTLRHVGPVGHGALTKLAVNTVFGAGVAVFAEAIAMLERAGVERATAIETLAGLPVTSPAVAQLGSLIARGRFEPMFPIRLVRKDFRYAVDTMRSHTVEPRIAEATREAFAAAEEAGLGDLNIAAIWKLYI